MASFELNGYLLAGAEYWPYQGNRDIDYPAEVLWGFYPQKGVVPEGETDPNPASANPRAIACAERAFDALRGFLQSDPPVLRKIVQLGAGQGYVPRFYLWTNDYLGANVPYDPGVREARLWYWKRKAPEPPKPPGYWKWESTLDQRGQCRVPAPEQIERVLAETLATVEAAPSGAAADTPAGELAALAREADLAAARAKLSAEIERLDTLVAAQRKDRALRMLAADAAWLMAFGFLEEDVETSGDDGARGRATASYDRVLGHGLALLALSNAAWSRALEARTEDFRALLAKTGKAEVAGLFFAGVGLWGKINLNRDDVELVSLLVHAVAMLERVAQLEPGFHDGDGQAMLGFIHASRSKAMGGKVDEGRRLLEAAIAGNRGRLLSHHVLEARSVAVQAGDRALFEQLLGQVIAAAPELWPERRLHNELAKRRARRWLDRVDQLF